MRHLFEDFSVSFESETVLFHHASILPCWEKERTENVVEAMRTEVGVVVVVSEMIAPSPLYQGGRNCLISKEEIQHQKTLVLFENEASEGLLCEEVVLELLHAFE